MKKKKKKKESDSIAVPLFTIRNKNPKNSDCEMSWLVYTMPHCHQVILLHCYPAIFSSCHLVSLAAFQLVSFTACASWSLRACFYQNQPLFSGGLPLWLVLHNLDWEELHSCALASPLHVHNVGKTLAQNIWRKKLIWLKVLSSNLACCPFK